MKSFAFLSISRRFVLGVFAALLSLSAVPGWAQTMQKVQQSKELRIGVAPGDPGYYRDPATGTWTGLGVMIGAAVAKDLGVKLVPVETTWGNCVAALQSGQIDVMFVLDATEERKKAVDFPASPLLWYAQGVLTRDNLVAKNWSDLDKPGIRIGVALGTATDRDLTKRLPHANIERFANTDETIAAFMSGRIDAFAFYDPALVIAYSKIHKGKVQTPKPLVMQPTSAGVRRETPPVFREYLNSEISKLYKSGKTQAMYVAYLKSKGIDASTLATLPGITKESLER